MKRYLSTTKRVALSLLLPTQLLAANINPPMALPSARVLPKGVRNFNYKGAFTTAENRFGSGGNEQVLAHSMNKSITFQEIIDGKDVLVDKYGIKQKMYSAGYNLEDEVAQSRGQINVAATAHVPVFAYGVSNRWTFAVAVPITEYDLNIDYGVVHTDATALNAFRESLEGIPYKKDEFEYKIMNPIGSKLADEGYAMPANEHKTVMGDIRLVNKISTYENANNLLTLVVGFTLPTGKEEDVNRLVNVGVGDGQTDFDLALAHDYYLGRYFTLSSGIGYTMQMKDHTTKRIPEKQDSTISGDIDTDTSRDLGDIARAEIAPKFNYGAFTTGVGYSFQYKQGDKYEGMKYAQEHYQWLQRDSVQRMQTVQAVIGVDTVSLYRQQKFLAPLALTLAHVMIVEGKNVSSDPITVVDFSLFF